MRKFNFLKKPLSAKDQSLQEELVNNYFDELQLSDEPKVAGDGVEFNSAGIYDRITAAIDDPAKRKNNIRKQFTIAAALLAGLCISVAAYYYQNNILDTVSPVLTKQIAAANGSVISVTLADGTKVWLNGGSKLTYPEKFRDKKREISLVGEAYLEVAHDAKRSFIVHTGSISTQVLGTSFNVKAYPEQDFVKVDVLTGKVGVIAPALNSKKSQTIFLTPAQEVMFNKKDHSVVKNQLADVNVLTRWKDGDLVFKTMPLPEVLTSIEHRFNVKINADINLAKCSISANFTNVRLEKILEIISKIVKGKAIQNGTVYRIKGKGC